MENIKKALVTGGNRGIGAGIVQCLAQDGYDVALTYATAREEADQLAKQIREDFGRECYVMQADFSTRGVAEAIVDKACVALGGLDLLVNNAASTVQTGSVLNFPVDVLDNMIEVNYRSCVMTCRKAAQYMVKNKVKGSIINISSLRSIRAFPRDGVYGGLKAAINRMTQSFAIDLGPFGIRVNCIAPGSIRIRDLDLPVEQCKEGPNVERVPLMRIGMPEDIGHAVVFFASDKASYITGQTLVIDGGFSLPGIPDGADESGAPCNAFGFYTEDIYHRFND